MSGPEISGTPTEASWRGRGDFYLYCRQQGVCPKEVSGHDPKKELVGFTEYEPLRNVSSNCPPTLLLHGEKGTDVPFEQSALMAQAPADNGVKHKFISGSEWGHAFDYGSDDQASVQEAIE